MSKNEQTVKAIRELIENLKFEVKERQDKIAALELAFKTLTGTPEVKAVQTNGKRIRKGVKIDRHGAKKTFEFLKERGENPTTVKMVARKFSITEEAASQRLLNLSKKGQAARLAPGKYVASTVVVQTAQA